MQRLYTLDYLRGATAFFIMIYHYCSWMSIGNSPDSFLGKIGIYGVSIFYILSGLTLYYVYQHNFTLSACCIKSFFLKRVFRIFPLLWLASILTILLSRELPTVETLILNLTGGFALFKPNDAIAVGAWSIGNELFFYLLFPLLIFTFKRPSIAISLNFIFLFVFGYFAYLMINPRVSLENNWEIYVNPLNQVFLFFVGMAIGKFFVDKTFSQIKIVIVLSLVILLFFLWPVGIERTELIYGTNRLVLSFCSVIICICFFKLNNITVRPVHQAFLFLGEVSYSIYLVHPIVFRAFNYVIKSRFQMNKEMVIICSMIITLIISFFVYEYFEKFFIRLSKNIKVK